MGKSREKTDTRSQLNATLDAFFKHVDSKNFYLKYDELQELILTYRDKLNKNEILDYCNKYCQVNELNDYQLEVFNEIIHYITGYCTPDKDIPWD